MQLEGSSSLHFFLALWRFDFLVSHGLLVWDFLDLLACRELHLSFLGRDSFRSVSLVGRITPGRGRQHRGGSGAHRNEGAGVSCVFAFLLGPSFIVSLECVLGLSVSCRLESVVNACRSLLLAGNFGGYSSLHSGAAG